MSFAAGRGNGRSLKIPASPARTRRALMRRGIGKSSKGEPRPHRAMARAATGGKNSAGGNWRAKRACGRADAAANAIEPPPRNPGP